MRHKKSVCEQNAKNLKLQDNDKGSYLATCINKNEAEAAAKNVLAKDTTKAGRDQETTSMKAAKSAPAQDHAVAKAKPKTKSKPKRETEKL